jgi:uncharacterized MAPEG superfamily protein
MTIAFWCVLIAALSSMIWTGIAKLGGSGFPASGNHNPRELLDALDGYRKRAHWAQLNSYEAFPPFAAAVIIAHIAQAPQMWIDYLAIAFVVFRLAYGVCYIKDWAGLRSAVWGCGLACVIALFVISA